MKPDNISHFTKARRVNHINYRLEGSIPQAVLKEAQRRRQEALDELHTDERTASIPEVIKSGTHRINAGFELELDNYLDSAEKGPMHLKKPELAKIVIDSLLFLHGKGAIFLYAACVMSNHVHVVVGPTPEQDSVDLSKFMQRHKRFTAVEINKVLKQTGNDFWQDNYFDRLVRDGKFTTVMWYVLNNPVKAGLTTDWRNWPHTWLNPEFDSLFR